MIRKTFIIISFVPIVIFIILWLWIQSLNEWSAFGAASIIVVPIILSFLTSFTGLLLSIRARRHGENIQNLLIATGLASIPALWFIYTWVTG